MLALYARGCEIIEEGEFEGREFGEVDVALHAQLGRKPWEASVFDADLDSEQPPAHLRAETRDWVEAQALRRELQAALDARRRRGRDAEPRDADRGGGEAKREPALVD
jgi:hypothetical protein